MPRPALELERDSISRWLSDTFPNAPVYVSTVPAGFRPPGFLVEVPRTASEPTTAAGRWRSTTVNVVYFGHLNRNPDGTTPWDPVAVAGRLEEVLQDTRHLIPLRDDGGAEVGKLRLEAEVSGRSGSDTDLAVSIRYRRLVWDRQPELEGQTLTDINFRQI